MRSASCHRRIPRTEAPESGSRSGLHARPRRRAACTERKQPRGGCRARLQTWSPMVPLLRESAATPPQPQLFFFKQKTAYEIGLGIPAEPLFRSALDEEKWLNMLGTFVKDWFRYESHFVHGRDSLVDILKERGLLSESDAVQPLIGKKS